MLWAGPGPCWGGPGGRQLAADAVMAVRVTVSKSFFNLRSSPTVVTAATAVTGAAAAAAAASAGATTTAATRASGDAAVGSASQGSGVQSSPLSSPAQRLHAIEAADAATAAAASLLAA